MHSALRLARRENEELQTKLEDSSRELSEIMSVNDTTAGEKVKLAEKDHELAVLKEVLEREKQKAKRYWQERCNELAKHKDD